MNACHDGLCKPVELDGGTSTCTWSELWRAECEVRWLLNMPLDRRNEALLMIRNKRGEAAMSRLEIELRIRIEKRRNAPSYFRSAPSTRSTHASTGARSPAAPSANGGSLGQLF